MKNIKKTLSVLGLLATTILVIAQTATYDAWFTWTPNPAHELVSGYRIEYRKLPVVTNWTYLSFTPSSTNIAVVKNLQGGFKYEFRAFAVNAIGTGTNLSNIIMIPTNVPSGVSGYQITTPR